MQLLVDGDIEEQQKIYNEVYDYNTRLVLIPARTYANAVECSQFLYDTTVLGYQVVRQLSKIIYKKA